MSDNELEAFRAQNPGCATLPAAAIEPYVDEHGGGLVVLARHIEGSIHVKMHDTWGPGAADGEPGDIVVHVYDSERDDDEGEGVEYFADPWKAYRRFLEIDRMPTTLPAMTVATLDTANFNFIALGLTPEDCRTALRKAWAEHRRQTGATWTLEDVYDSVNYLILKPGQVARDGSVIV